MGEVTNILLEAVDLSRLSYKHLMASIRHPLSFADWMMLSGSA